ncbi:MAG: hypothetical protein FJ388_11420, partial [Verrucomicrobia bacterium]|nr:hypothetical protein [Verrucomicrobiota bacterium]
MLTSASLGEFPLVKQRMEDRDGKPYDLDTDIAGQSRERHAGAVVPGPFAKLAKGKNAFRFSAGASASSFVNRKQESPSHETRASPALQPALVPQPAIL